jgi:ion channel-forming bestrophin family protein
MRMHGSVTPRMIVPLIVTGCWATLITCISHFVYPLVVSNVLLTILGFVVALSISFRTSSAYERYADGRRFWSQLSQISRDLARNIWIHAEERHDQDAELGKADLLAKLTALNLIVAFAVSLKHKLRFEPYTNYPDLEHLVSHLSTYAGDASAHDPSASHPKPQTPWKKAGNYLAIPFAQSNPRKLLKSTKRPLGNLPLEILTYLTSYLSTIISNNTFPIGPLQAAANSNLASLNEVMTGTERVLNTPLPLAYSIAISQITWVYVLALPFQLYDSLHWITIPGTLLGAYIILGIAAIGKEIENPFGDDVNDLPLDTFCRQLSAEIDIITSKPPPRKEEWIESVENRVLYPLSMGEYGVWSGKSVEDIREALRVKAVTAKVANEPTRPMEEGVQMGV